MSEAFRIEFELTPLVQVAAWGEPGAQSLNWFGLTDGRYDVVISEQRLFSDPNRADGIDYQVVRLWEDLIELLPEVVDEIPSAIATRLEDVDAWVHWVDVAWDLEELDPQLEVFERATSWWSDRSLSSGHLVAAPRLHLWRTSSTVHASWRSRPREIDEPRWASPNGDATIALTAFTDEVGRFDRALISEMGTRIDEVATSWSRPDVAIDLDQLRREHLVRASSLTDTLARVRTPRRPWDEVVAAITTLENHIGPVR